MYTPAEQLTLAHEYARSGGRVSHTGIAVSNRPNLSQTVSNCPKLSQTGPNWTRTDSNWTEMTRNGTKSWAELPRMSLQVLVPQ